MIEVASGDFPDKNIKKITYRENGTIESVEYFEDKKKTCYHYCNCSGCNCHWQRSPWTVTTTTGDNVRLAVNDSTYTTNWGNL